MVSGLSAAKALLAMVSYGEESLGSQFSESFGSRVQPGVSLEFRGSGAFRVCWFWALELWDRV